eukprot:6459166-Prymnesium_polylepis.1
MAARSAAFRFCWAGDGMVRVQSSADMQAAASGSLSGVWHATRNVWHRRACMSFSAPCDMPATLCAREHEVARD